MSLNFRIAVNETLENVISLINHKYVLYKHTKKTYTMLGNIVEIYSNEDYDEILSADYEDGFLYYQTYMDFYPANEVKIKEALIKSDVQIAQSDFSSDCIETTQAYFVYGKEFLCKMTENMQARCTSSRQAGFNQCFLNSQIELARDIKLFFNNFGWKSEIIAEFEDKINI